MSAARLYVAGRRPSPDASRFDQLAASAGFTMRPSRPEKSLSVRRARNIAPLRPTAQPEETGVVQRFGAVDRMVGPELHFKLPAGIESVRRVPTERILKESFGFGVAGTSAGGKTRYGADKKAFREGSPMPTGGPNVIDVQWLVQYRVEDPVRHLFESRESRETIRDVAEAVMRRVPATTWAATCRPSAAWPCLHRGRGWTMSRAFPRRSMRRA